MNFRAKPRKNLFKLRYGSDSGLWRNFDQVRRSQSMPPDFGEVGRMVGRYVKNTVLNESAAHRGQKAAVDQTPRCVSPLRPWIGKHQMENGDGISRQHFGNRIRNLESENSCIRQAALFELPTGASDPSQLPFDSEKVPSRIGSGDGREEGSFAATQINFEGSGPAE
jgi:hypothetical protein